MAWDVEEIRLADEEYFETLNGLWAGKKPPFVHAGVIRNTNFAGLGTVDFSNVAWLNVEAKQIAKRQLKRGDIIIERSGGGPKQPVGRVVFFNRSDGLFSFSNFTSAVRVRRMDVFDPKFIFYSLSELYQSGRTEDIQRRTTGIRNLDFGAYKERATIPVIPLCEQREIAAVLGLVQRAIEQQERLVALTGELKRTLMHKLFTEGLRGELQKQTEIGPVPESWDVVPLGSVLRESPKNGLYKHQSLYGTGTLILRINDFSNDGDVVGVAANRVAATCEEIGAYGLQENDIVFNRVNSLSHLGKTAIVGRIAEPLIFESNMMRVRVDHAKIEPRFLFRLLNSPICKKQVMRSAKRAVAQSSINQGNLKAFEIPLPPLDEQREIVRMFNAITSKSESHIVKRDLLSDLFRTLLHQLMTAQIRVNDLDLSEIEAVVGEA